MSDGEGGTSTATVSVTVTDTDDMPQAFDDPSGGPLSVGEGATISIDVLANDLGLGDPNFYGDRDAAVVPGLPARRARRLSVGSPGPASAIHVDYTAPVLECGGTVTFDYTVTDCHGDPTRRPSR